MENTIDSTLKATLEQLQCLGEQHPDYLCANMHTHSYIQGEYLNQDFFGNITLKDKTLINSGACKSEAEMFQKLQEKMDELKSDENRKAA